MNHNSSVHCSTCCAHISSVWLLIFLDPPLGDPATFKSWRHDRNDRKVLFCCFQYTTMISFHSCRQQVELCALCKSRKTLSFINYYYLHDRCHNLKFVEVASQNHQFLTLCIFISTFSYSIPNVLYIFEKLISCSTFWWENIGVLAL